MTDLHLRNHEWEHWLMSWRQSPREGTHVWIVHGRDVSRRLIRCNEIVCSRVLEEDAVECELNDATGEGRCGNGGRVRK